MARVILVTGGCRSGKSAHAQKLAEGLGGKRVYVATCPVVDDEMRQRIDKHQQARCGAGWDTIEEPVDLAAAIARADGHDVLLVDCLTLWASNVMYFAQQSGGSMGEDEIARLAGEVLVACRGRNGTVILVTNEVGMGIVPENALARRYRDVIGRVNQTIAAGADEVTFVACGIPLKLKG